MTSILLSLHVQRAKTDRCCSVVSSHDHFRCAVWTAHESVDSIVLDSRGCTDGGLAAIWSDLMRLVESAGTAGAFDVHLFPPCCQCSVSFVKPVLHPCFRIVDQFDARIPVPVGNDGDVGALSIEVAKHALLGQFESRLCDFLVGERYSEVEQVGELLTCLLRSCFIDAWP